MDDTYKKDEEVEELAAKLWKTRGYRDHYLIEWRDLSRPFKEGSVAWRVLSDAEDVVMGILT